MSLATTLRTRVSSLIGLSQHDIYLLKSIRHRGWVWRAFFPGPRVIPIQPFTYAPLTVIDDNEIALCARLIEAYSRGAYRHDVLGTLSPMWKELLANKQLTLHVALQKREPRILAELLREMFRREIMYGIDPGDLYTGRNWRIHSLKLLDELASLGEQLGVTSAESGHGPIGHAFEHGLAGLVERIEAAIATPIGVPEIGGAYGIYAGASLLTLQSPEYTYVAWRIREAIATYAPDVGRLDTVEIGAGYGGMAYFLLRILGERVSRYQIVDLPEMNVLQGYYLSKALGPERVTLFGETERAGHTPQVRILPTHALRECGDADLLINENSLPEIPIEAATGYLGWAADHVRKFFYSYNHESWIEGRFSPVATVPEVIAAVGGWSRRSRTASWLRPGYVEEIYIPKSH